jgi:hypothetical protein
MTDKSMMNDALTTLLKSLPDKQRDFMEASPKEFVKTFEVYLATLMSARDLAGSLGRKDMFNILCGEIVRMTPKKLAAVAGAQ